MSIQYSKLEEIHLELAQILNNSTIIFFDLETQNLFVELEPKWNSMKWKDKQKIRVDLCKRMKVSIAGLLFFKNGKPTYKYFTEDNIQELEEELLKATKIIGHNLLEFDYDVLYAYIPKKSLEQIKNKTLDTMKLMSEVTKQWSSLDDLGNLNFDIGKTINTLEIPKMWRDGKYDEVRDYLKIDLDLLAGVFYYGLSKQPLKYNVKDYGRLVGQKEVILDWKNRVTN
ncbi:MAG: hypothetical protein HeimC2_40310 [Candidatus Heimdallarchaeota archaeon LC_2]|nr:MAG: hypothetical protein HeimC2_40310 [Candidatus Heimdallarchaeota archaeon LC_2]